MARYGLVVDLNRCTGCYACVVACKSENSTLPGAHWIRIDEVEQGEYPKVSKSFIPMFCMQCGEMPCARACPTGAIYADKNGVVLIDDESCTCGDVKPCVQGCPLGLLSIHEAGRSYFKEYLTPHEKELYEAHRNGAMEKCNLCYPRITSGLQPSCVQACPSQAMVFGDLHEPQSEVSRLVSTAKAGPLNEALHLDPSVLYVRERTASERSLK